MCYVLNYGLTSVGKRSNESPLSFFIRYHRSAKKINTYIPISNNLNKSIFLQKRLVFSSQ